jgi:hypothetical protein
MGATLTNLHHYHLEQNGLTPQEFELARHIGIQGSD